MNHLFVTFKSSKVGNLIFSQVTSIYIILLVVIFSFLYFPLQIPLNIAFLADITTSVNYYHHPLAFLTFNDLHYSLETTYEAPGYIWTQSIIQSILQSSMLTLMLFWLILSLVSLIFTLKLLPLVQELQSGNHPINLNFTIVSLLLLPFLFMYYPFDFFLVFIFFNTPFLYFFFKGTKLFFNSDYATGKRYIFTSFFFLALYFIFFGQIALFVLFIGFIYLILKYNKHSLDNSHFYRNNNVYKLFLFGIVEIVALIILFMAFYNQNILFYIISSFIVYFIFLLVSDHVLIADSNLQEATTRDGNQELKKLLRQFQILYLTIILGTVLLLVWFSFFSNLPTSPLHYQVSFSSLINFYETLFSSSFLLFCTLALLFILGLIYLFLSKEYSQLIFYGCLELISVLYIIIGPPSLFTTILILAIGPFFICIEGLYYALSLPKILFDVRGGFDKYFPAFFFNLSLFIGLLVLNLDAIFYEQNFSTLVNILLFTLVVTGLTVILTYFVVTTFVDFVLSFFLSLFIAISLFTFNFELNSFLSMLLFLVILGIYYYTNYAKMKSKLTPQVALFLFIIFLSSFSYATNVPRDNYTLEDVALMIKDHNVTNTSYWVFPDQSVRLYLKYLLHGLYPVNYGNYGNFPFTDNSSQNLDQYIHTNPQVKFFIVNMTYLLDQHFFTSISWLKASFTEYKVSFLSPSKNTEIYFYIKL